MTLYNDNDPTSAAWLRELIRCGHLPAGTVDERSITDLKPADCQPTSHFFAGIGGWPYALQIAGWPDAWPVWTGSCPCQPLSCAGQRKGHADERHLWPAFYALVAKCRPPTLFIEQVDSVDGREWISGVRADLEGLGYAVGIASLCAAGSGAPHIRQRLFGVAHAESQYDGRRHKRSAGRLEFTKCCPACGGSLECRACFDDGDQAYACELGHHFTGAELERLANAAGGGLGADRRAPGQPGHAEQRDQTSGLGDAPSKGREGSGPELPPRRGQQLAAESGFWARSRWHACTDGKSRRVPEAQSVLQCLDSRLPDGVDLGGAESGFPLAGKIQGRAALLKGYGNAIVPQLAAVFIRAFLDVTP